MWSDLDEDAVGQCRQAVENCKRYNTKPAPYFELCLRMYQALNERGLLERVALDREVCAGCVHKVESGCQRGFTGAAISSEERRVVFCRAKTTAEQLEARRAAYKRRYNR